VTAVAPNPFALAAAAFTPSSEEAERAETIRRMTTKWQQEARPNQLPPPGDWFVLLFLAGAGWGKTRTGAEWAASKGREFSGCRFALVAPTFADGRDIMVEGESGLLSVLRRRRAARRFP
jgi:phage terminase large subunit-like protein